MRALLLGDIHNSMRHVAFACEWAESLDCDRIVQLGDWGALWPQHLDQSMTEGYGTKRKPLREPPEEGLNRLERVLAEYDIPMYFIDGNHECYRYFALLKIDINGEEMQRISPHVTYLPRGCAFEWDGVRFLALGGAVSINQESMIRRHGKYGWDAREAITNAQVERAISRGKVDVMLCHDTVELPGLIQLRIMEGGKAGTPSRDNRLKVSRVARATRPNFLYHGHYHYAYEAEWEGIRVRGLGRDGHDMDSMWVFDTEEYRKGRQR